MTAIEFVRILSNSKEWLRTISLIAIAEASTRTLTPELETFGVFLANKRTWKSDVPRFLSTLDHAFDCDVGERDRVQADQHLFLRFRRPHHARELLPDTSK